MKSQESWVPTEAFIDLSEFGPVFPSLSFFIRKMEIILTGATPTNSILYRRKWKVKYRVGGNPAGEWLDRFKAIILEPVWLISTPECLPTGKCF